MTWSDLCASVDEPHEQMLMDAALTALRRSADPSLHACVSAEVPTLPKLCLLLDAHGVAVPQGVEQPTIAYRLAST
jgi:hypothetical protein